MAGATPRSVQMSRATPLVSTPQMVLPEVQPLLDASMLLAKSEADELLEEVFMSVPLLVGGGIVGFIASYPLEEELGDNAKLAVPATAVFFLAAAKLGILGTAAGFLAKFSLDAWNLFANVALKGAVLKY